MIVILKNIKNNIKLWTHIKVILVFSVLYWLGGILELYYEMKTLETNEYIKPMNMFDAFYFSLVTQTTVGYGNVLPKSRLSQAINIIQLFGLLLIYI